MDPISIVFWLFIIFSMLTPYMQQQTLVSARTRKIAEMERKRKSRVITLIHRQEAISFLGVPLSRFITVDDSEHVLRAIRMTDDQTPIDLVIHTPGGLVLAAEQIARALKKHPAKVTVFVPHYAMSGGTLIALGADEIVMDEHAVLGPVDPQLGQYPAASVLKTVEEKGAAKVDDQTLIYADISRKALKQVRDFVFDLLKDKLPEDKAGQVADVLSQGTWTHDYPIFAEDAKKLGLPVSTEMPKEVYDLMELYPQPQMGRPSVQYVPTPHQREVSPPSKRSKN